MVHRSLAHSAEQCLGSQMSSGRQLRLMGTQLLECISMSPLRPSPSHLLLVEAPCSALQPCSPGGAVPALCQMSSRMLRQGLASSRAAVAQARAKGLELVPMPQPSAASCRAVS